MKGKSRRKSQDSSSSEGNSKRKKIDKDEREKEFEELSKAMKDIDEQIEYKQLHLKRQKSIHEYSKCDQIMGEIIKLRNEKKIQEKQLKRMEKKNAKSKWYHNRKDKEKKADKTGESKRKRVTKTLDIAQAFRKESSDVSTSTSAGVSDSNESLPDTIILSPDEADVEVTIIPPSKSPLDDVNQPPLFINHSDSEEAGSQSPNLFSQQVNKNLVGEHIQVGNKRCDDTGDEESQIAMDDKDFP